MCVNVYMRGALRWTGIPSRVNSCLVPSGPGIGSVTHNRVEQLLKMNEGKKIRFLSYFNVRLN